MEKQELKKFFESIKKDDVKSFGFYVQEISNLNVCFGRFPVLSLLYLYKSYKILNKYEKLLLPVRKYERCEEFFEIYLKFKKVAKKSLRLYMTDDAIVYPVEMLALIDAQSVLKVNYKLLFKSVQICENLRKIYKINHKIEINADLASVMIPYKNFNRKQKMIAFLTGLVFSIATIISSISLIFVNGKFGLGTKGSPITIKTAAELKTALGASMYYILENDIVLDDDTYMKDFSGVLDGNGKTVYISENGSGLVNNLSGTIKNLKLNVNAVNKKIVSNFSYFAQNSTGEIENCEIFGTFDAYVDAIDDIYLSMFVVENNGLIENCQTYVDVFVENAKSVNVFVAGFAGVNNSEILNVQNKAKEFVTDTVDVAGIACTNNGKISNAINNSKLYQESGKEWHPNTSGVSITNYGVIENSSNVGEIVSVSKTETLTAGDELHVYASGIVCENVGEVISCTNSGKILANGKIAFVFAGGIVALNVYSELKDGVIISGKISKSKAICDIEAQSDKGEIYVGGVGALNASYLELNSFGFVTYRKNSSIDQSGFVGKIVTNSARTYVGGVVAQNRYGALSNSYASMVAEDKSDALSKEVVISGVIGFAYPVYDTLLNNHYVKNENIACGVQVYTTNGFIYAINVVDDSVSKSTAHESYENIPDEVKNVG